MPTFNQLNGDVSRTVVSFLTTDCLSTAVFINVFREHVCDKRIRMYFKYFTMVSNHDNAINMLSILISNETGKNARDDLRESIDSMPPTRSIVTQAVIVSVHDSFKLFQKIFISDVRNTGMIWKNFQLSQSEIDLCCGVIQSIIVESVEIFSVMTCSFKLLYCKSDFKIVVSYQQQPPDIEIFTEHGDDSESLFEDPNCDQSPLPAVVGLSSKKLSEIFKVLISFPKPTYPGCYSFVNTHEIDHLVSSHLNGEKVKKHNVM